MTASTARHIKLISHVVPMQKHRRHKVPFHTLLPMQGWHARVDVPASCGHGHGGSVGSGDQWRALRSFSSHANIFTHSLQNVEIILLVDTARCGAEKTLNLF